MDKGIPPCAAHKSSICNRDVCLSLIREAPLRVASTSTRHELMRIKQSRCRRQGEIKAATGGVSR